MLSERCPYFSMHHNYTWCQMIMLQSAYDPTNMSPKCHQALYWWEVLLTCCSLSHGSVLGSDPDSSPSDECEGECLEFDVDLFICTSVTLSLLFSGLTDDSEALESSRPSLASSWSDALLMEDCNMQKIKTIGDYVQQSSHHECHLNITLTLALNFSPNSWIS